MNYYGNVSSDYKIQRDAKNKSASRYNDANLKNKLKNSDVISRREKKMIKDRMHILDRMSNSCVNDDIQSASDFSDVKSIQHRRKTKVSRVDITCLIVFLDSKSLHAETKNKRKKSGYFESKR